MQRCTFFFLLLALSGLISSTTLHAQEVWDLRRCIEYAQQNSTLIKQAAYSISNAELTLKQNKFERLPSVNSSISGGIQFGRTIDPTTNTFDNQTIGSNSLSLDAGIPLYAGGRISNLVEQSRIDVEVAKLNAQATGNDLALRIANAYLNILLAEEQAENARARVKLSEVQLQQTDKRIQAGTLPENDRLDFVAQIARDQLTIVQFENQATINYLTLKNLLELEPGVEITLERPEFEIPVDVDPTTYQFSEIFARALETQPQIKSSELQIQSAELEIDLARASILPSVSLFGSMNSFFSTRAIDRFIATGESRPGNPIPVIIDGNQINVQFLDPVLIPDEARYFKQINENFGQSVGLSINIPIYNKHRNILAMERARLGVLNQQVNTLQARQQLRTDVQQAIANARAAKRAMEAAQLSLNAAKGAFDNGQRQYDLGTINSLEYTTARNNLDMAQIELTRSKYEYLFYLKIVEFYQGKQLNLD